MMERHDESLGARRRLDESMRHLLDPDRHRELSLLMKLQRTPCHAAELAADLEIDHPEKMRRATRFLEKLGLVDRFYDKKFAKRGNLLRLSPLGAIAQERVTLVNDFIRSISALELSGPTHLTLSPVGETPGGLTQFSISVDSRAQISREFAELLRLLEDEAERIHYEETEIRKRIDVLKQRIQAAEQAA